MTMPKKRRPLTGQEIEIVRLVAQGYTNEQIAKAVGMNSTTLQNRIYILHCLLGTSAAGAGSAGMARVRMTIWAYENGIVKPRGGAIDVALLTPEEALIERAFAACRAMVLRRPQAREQAVAVIRERDADLAGDDPTWQAAA